MGITQYITLCPPKSANSMIPGDPGVPVPTGKQGGWGGNLPKGFRNLKPSIREKPE